MPTQPAGRIEAAYNDAAGVTAEFNRNILHVLNRELGADFDVGAFQHHAPYSTDHHRVEMHLVARGDQQVSIPQLGTVVIRNGESIRTEICGKYDRRALDVLLARADLHVADWRIDAQDEYALVLAQPMSAIR